MPRNEKEQVKIYLSTEARDVLREHAKTFGVTMSVDIEKAIVEVLKPELEETK